MEDPFSPASKPAFASKETAEAVAYAGADVRPVFDDELQAPDPEAPSPGYVTRYREVARLHASGLTNNQIAEQLGYTPPRVSIILKDPFVQTEIRRWRDNLFDADDIALMKQGASDSIQKMLRLIHDPETKPETLLRLGQFFVEQAHGKARQGIDIKHSSLDQFIALAEKLGSLNAGPDTIDVSALPEVRRAEGSDQEAQTAQTPEPLDAVDSYFALRAK